MRWPRTWAGYGRTDLAAVSRPQPVDPGLDAEQLRRDRINAGKKELNRAVLGAVGQRHHRRR
ncbi:MAG: hypothetical protein V7643_2792 [Mycobacterium sp.]|jgi:hypothetical protein